MHTLVGAGLTLAVSTVGARISSIVGLDGREWLVPASHPEPDPTSSIDFARGTRGGWDECLPSIDALADPNSDGSLRVADHGDFWFRPWRVESASTGEVVFDTATIPHRVQMRKAVRVSETIPLVQVDYAITNAGATPYSLVYSAHPLWAMPNGAHLHLVDGGRVVPAFGFDAAGGRWPILGEIDLTEIAARSGAATSKYFVEWNGEARLTLTDGRSLTLRQPTTVTRWLGVCVNQRSWPPDAPGPDWIALEATTSPTDSLERAIADGTALTLAPGETVEWTSELEFGA